MLFTHQACFGVSWVSEIQELIAQLHKDMRASAHGQEAFARDSVQYKR